MKIKLLTQRLKGNVNIKCWKGDQPEQWPATVVAGRTNIDVYRQTSIHIHLLVHFWGKEEERTYSNMGRTHGLIIPKNSL